MCGYLGGWSSDEDDSYLSSEYDSHSRESSAGSTRSGGHGSLRRNKTMSQLPPVPTPRNKDHYSQQLSVDIPNSCKYKIEMKIFIHFQINSRYRHLYTMISDSSF